MKQPFIYATDIGTSNVKVMVGQTTSNGDMIIMGMGTAPTAGFSKGIISDVRELVQSIIQALECASLATKATIGSVYLGLSGTAIRVYHCRGSISPSSRHGIGEEDVARVGRAAMLLAVPNDAHVLHTWPVAYWVDGELQVLSPVGQVGLQLEVQLCVVTISQTLFAELTSGLQQAGITLAGIVANSVAQSTHMSDQDSAIFIDIGAGTADLSFYHEGLNTVAILPLGGDYITQDITQGIAVNLIHGEEIKRYYAKLNSELYGQGVLLDCNDYGTTDKQVAYDFLYKIVESRIDEIVNLMYEQTKTDRFSAAQEIILTGGCCHLPSVACRLQEVFGLPVRLAIMGGVTPEYASHANTAVYGLLHYAIKQEQNKQSKQAIALGSLWKRIRNYF